MPQVSLIGWVTWALVALAQLALVVVMVRTGSWRRWPSIFVYASIRTACTFALMLMARPKTDFGAACYFYTYWIEAAALGVVQVWIIREIGLSVASLHRGIRNFLSRLVPAIAILYVLGSVLIIGIPAWSPAWMIPEFVGAANKATAVAWFATFLTLLFSCQALGVVSNRLERGVSSAFCGLLIVNFATGFLYGSGASVQRAAMASEFQEVAQAVALAGWIWIFCKEPLREELPSLDTLRTLLAHYLTITDRLRTK